METSCGVVLVNYGAVLLLQYPQGHWDLPKGHVEENDSDRTATMLRELAEETGIADVTVLNGFEERTEYTFRHKGKRKSKEVYWYVAETETMEVGFPTNTAATSGWTGTKHWRQLPTMKLGASCVWHNSS